MNQGLVKYSKSKKIAGLTLIEVLVSVVILSIVLVAFAGIIVSNIRQNATSGNRTAAAQVMNYLGRRTVNADTVVVPAVGEDSRAWDYQTLNTSFPELSKERNAANPDLYRAEVLDQGAPAWYTAGMGNLVSYQINVCWQDAGDEKCVSAQTIAPRIVNPSAVSPVIPGFN
jgi:prepilin-type N-terminal cleavage/methylation domain-containing protein